MLLQLPAAFANAEPLQDYSQAAAHVAALTQQHHDAAIIDVRCIHDVRNDLPAHSFRGTLAELWPTILDYQSRGFGAFINVNELDGAGRDNSNVRAIRAHVVDLDNVSAPANFELAAHWLPAPSFAVGTSPARFHVYWIVAPYNDLAGAEKRQRQLRQQFDGDKSVIDAARVLRLAGTLHLKDPANPHMANCWQLAGYGAPVALEALDAALALITVIEGGGGRHALGEPSLAAPSLDWLKAALASIDPNELDRGEWIKLTAAIKQAGWSLADEPTLREIWGEFCARYATNDPGENDKQWRSIRDTEAGWSSIARRMSPDLRARLAGFTGGQQLPLPIPEPGRSFEQILNDANALPPDDGNADAVERLCTEATKLPPVKKDAVLRAIQKATGISLTALRKQANGQDGEGEPDHLELARKTIKAIGNGNIIHAEQFTWKFSTIGVWKRCDDRQLKQHVQSTLANEHLAVTAPRVNGVADVLKSEIFKPDHEFNKGNPESVNCLNGELELIEGQWRLVSHRRELYRTTQIPIGHDPYTQAPLFWQFLNDIFRDDADRDDKINVVLEMMGYSLMSHANRERFVLLIGAGANGKSVLLATLEALLGKANVAGVQPANFDNRFQRGHLHQKLANIVTELKQGETIADAELKAITSGELATVEHKNKDPFVMRPFSTCWFGTNHMPHTRDYSDAFFRRAIVITFNRVFQPHEQDPGLKDRLATELPGILNLVLWAYARVVAHNRFSSPASSMEAKKKWQLEADQVAQFVEMCCQRLPDGRVPVDVLFNSYLAWARTAGIRMTVGKQAFGDRLERLQFVRTRTNSDRMIGGISLIGHSWTV